MASENLEVVQITPDPDALVIKHTRNHGLYECTEDSCSFKTCSPSVLGLHKAKVHNITTGAKKGQVYQYYCPVNGCCFNPQSGRFFKTLDILRVHYMHVHSEKKFKCPKCGKAFGLERDCVFHEKECGQSFTCPDCGKIYNNKKALSGHCLSKGHKKPPELCPKPRKSSALPNKSETNKSHPVYILPKLPTLDKAPALFSMKNNAVNLNNVLLPAGFPITVVPQNKSSISTVSNPTLTSSPKLLCDNDTQTVKSLSSASSQTTSKYHMPTQTGLSILEKAMRTSKISVPKSSKAVQKSWSQCSPRKRKTVGKSETLQSKRKSLPRMTVATLTDPLFKNRFSQNAESQTVYSILENQLKILPVSVVQIQDKSSICTQTCQEVHNLQQVPENCLPSNQSLPFQCSLSGNEMFANSFTQTFGPMIPQMVKEASTNNETQTSCKQSFSLKTQTQQILALDSSTQTLQPNPNTTDFLRELLTENERTDVDTQTFSDFFSDMMTQTLEEFVSEPSAPNMEVSTDMNDIFGFSEMTTQTLDVMTDSDTQTFDLDIADCMTQTTFRNDSMTQTLSNFRTDIMTQTFDSSDFDCNLQHLGLQGFRATYQPENVERNESAVQTSFGNNCSTTTQTSDDHEILGGNDCFSVSVNSNIVNAGGVNRSKDSAFTHSTHEKLFASTPPVSCYPCEDTPQPFNSLFGEASTQAVNPVAHSTTQTSSQHSKDLMLEKFLSDMATQTFEDENISFDVLMDSSDDFSAQFGQEPAPVMTDSVCQTPVPFYAGDVFTFGELKQNTQMSIGNSTQTLTQIGEDNPGEKGTQTGVGNSWETATQTGFDDMSVIGTQTVQDLWEIATQTGAIDLWEMGTQTGRENSWEMSTQTGVENVGVVGTQTVEDMTWGVTIQTVRDELWGIPTQTGAISTQTEEDNSWEIATQTWGDNMLAIGTQKRGCNFGIQTTMCDSWENGTQTDNHGVGATGTQTGEDNSWEMATQTWADDMLAIGTQTRGCNFGIQTAVCDSWENGTQTDNRNVGATGTQTGEDNSWEMVTQTEIDDLWEIGSQRGVQSHELLSSAYGTQTDNQSLAGTSSQTGEDNSWEIATQTGVDDLWEIGTQTIDSLLTDTMTQTGDDLIDFLTGKGVYEEASGTADVRMSCTQTDPFQESNQTQTTDAICLSDLDLFENS